MKCPTCRGKGMLMASITAHVIDQRGRQIRNTAARGPVQCTTCKGRGKV